MPLDVQPLVLAAAISAVAVFVAAVAGQTIGAVLGTRASARINVEGQREIERDRAIRDYRLQRVRRILDRADNRVADYFELNQVIYPWEPDRRDDVQAALLKVESKQLAVHMLGEMPEIPAAVEFVQAVHTLAKVDGEWASAARAVFNDQTSSFNALLNPYLTDYNEALRQAHLAAISYVFG